MKIIDTNFKRFIASEGMALKWTEERWSYPNKCYEPTLAYSEQEALIDQNNIIGNVEEVPLSEFKEWSKDKCYCIHPIFRE